jgi:hypothetical protein
VAAEAKENQNWRKKENSRKKSNNNDIAIS